MRLKSFLIAALLPFSYYGQMVVDNTSMTVEQYIQNVLVGAGVAISNVQLNGGPANVSFEQVGSFTDATSSMGFGNGLILGSGDVMMAAQANTAGSSSLGGSTGTGSDTDLASITPNQIYDECIVEFDFIPGGDSIIFNYVFASEEYDEYVCGSVNDAFGFFLSGPNPAGGAYTAQNVALIPDPANPGQYTTTPVSINTVNLGVAGSNGTLSNCTSIDPNFANYNVFYTQNTGTDYEYDGKTVILPVRVAVECGATYHIKLAIGDGGDSSFDSGVLLEAGSFSSNAVSIDAGITGGDTLLYEGCTSAFFAFERLNLNDDFTIYLLTGGQAINGTDYPSIPDSIVIPAGQASDTIFVTPINDSLPEGEETMTIVVMYEACGGYDTVTASLSISDYTPMTTSLIDSLNICTAMNEQADLDFTFSGGLEPYSIIWSTGEVTEDITATPMQHTQYNVSVTDECDQTAVDSVMVYVQCPLTPPNVFTPNGDGQNDKFIISNYTGEYFQPSLMVFNRWGKVVYQMDNYQDDWDGTHYKSGKKLNDGVYYFVITPNSPKYEYQPELEEVDLKRTITGFVHIMH